jgi:hypothetical protein
MDVDVVGEESLSIKLFASLSSEARAVERYRDVRVRLLVL